MPPRKSSTQRNKRMKKDPAFERTRENNNEFGRAGEANKLIRHAFREAILPVADRYISGRLTKRMFRIILSDTERRRGKRIVTAKALPMLEGFNFNRVRSLGDTWYASYEVSFNLHTRLVDIHFPFFVPRTMVDTQSKADECWLTAAIAVIDFAGKKALFAQQESVFIEQNDTNTSSIHFALQAPKDNTHPVIVTLGVTFPAGKVYNAKAVVKVFV